MVYPYLISLDGDEPEFHEAESAKDAIRAAVRSHNFVNRDIKRGPLHVCARFDGHWSRFYADSSHNGDVWPGGQADLRGRWLY